MDLKINNKQLLELCLQDRAHPFQLYKKKMPIIKKLNLDLFIKIIIFFVNCIGKKTAENIIFIDEVKNNSMIINMNNTMLACPKKYCIANFRELKKENHIKLGIIYSLFRISKIAFSFLFLFIIYPLIGNRRFTKYSATCLINEIQNVHKKMSNLGVKNEFVMTDHNFYSTVLCNSAQIRSYVLQHGLIFDKYLYQPVLADCFLAWGKRSKEILRSSDKIVVSGTYRFDNIRPINRHTTKTILFCVSGLDFIAVADKIADIESIAEKIGYTLSVKLHPGSFFNESGLEEKFLDVHFFKEEPLTAIPFDIAIIEYSTVLLDMLYLDKPYIVYADAEYFSPYKDIPMASNKNELKNLLESVPTINYKAIKNIIFSDELNSGICSIFK